MSNGCPDKRSNPGLPMQVYARLISMLHAVILHLNSCLIIKGSHWDVISVSAPITNPNAFTAVTDVCCSALSSWELSCANQCDESVCVCVWMRRRRRRIMRNCVRKINAASWLNSSSWLYSNLFLEYQVEGEIHYATKVCSRTRYSGWSTTQETITCTLLRHIYIYCAFTHWFPDEPRALRSSL